MGKGTGLIKTKLTFAGLTGSLIITSIIVVLLSHGLLFFISSRSAMNANAQSALNSAQNSASNLANLISVLHQGLIVQAGDSRLGEILAQGDPGMIRQEEDRLTHAVSSAWLVRLLPGNLDVPDESRSPKMGFSDLHMVTNAATGTTGTTGPAINLGNTSDVHLAMAHRVGNSGWVIHASWPVQILNGALTTEGGCGVALRQENIDIAYQGAALCRDNNKAPDGEVEVKGLALKIVYWSQPEVPLNFPWFAASLLVSLLLIGGLGILLIRVQYAGLRHDRKSLLNIANAVVNSNPSVDFSFKIKEIEQMGTDIAKVKRVQRDPKASAPRPQPTIKMEAPPEKKVEEPIVETEAIGQQGNHLELSPDIFRANDIRGIVGETLTPDVCYALGLGIGSEMNDRGENFIAVAHDGRLSSPELCNSLCKGLVDSGRTVINIGLVPTPLMYFATHTLNAQSGVIVTGSHNPANYNGLKIVIEGDTLSGEAIQNLRTRIQKGNFVHGKGRMNAYNLLPEYIERVVGDTQLGRPLKVVVDCGNGSASVAAPKLIRSIGCEVIELFCEVDGRFPNHHPDPGNPANLEKLIKTVLKTKADLGLAYDGDGDRLGLVDSSGKIIWPDRQMMLFAADVLSREPGADIIYDVKCTRNLASQIAKSGGRPIMSKTGHAPMKAKLKETGAMLAGEMSGHIFFQERWYGFDDAIYAGIRMIEILSNAAESSAEVFAQLPDSISTPELGVLLKEGENQAIMAKLTAFAEFADARITNIDGLRVDFLEGWGLVRASNTLPALTFRFEADSEKALEHIQQQFKEQILQVEPDLKLPF